MIEREFDSVARHFNHEALRVWRAGLRWLREQKTSFGILAWEPFFVGLLVERDLFASRLLEAGLRRERLLYRLNHLTYEGGTSNSFSIDTIREELPSSRDDYYGDFWSTVLGRDLTNLTPEETLALIGEMVGNTVEGDWKQMGSLYLEHPGVLEEGGLLGDAIIGEVSGNDRAFAVSLESMARQAALQIDLNVVWREGRILVFPSSQVAGVTVGRLGTDRLTALEASVTNQMRLVEHSAIREFEELINRRRVREVEIQEFLEAHPEILGGTSTLQIHAHPVLRSEDDRLIPDFILESSTGGSRILDLKLPTDRVIVGSGNRRRLAGAIHRGIAQLYDYSTAVAKSEERERIRVELGLDCLQPELCLVIGRTKDVRESEDLRRLSHRDLRREVHVMSYDDLLKEAKSRALYVEPDLAAKVGY